MRWKAPFGALEVHCILFTSSRNDWQGTQGPALRTHHEREKNFVTVAWTPEERASRASHFRSCTRVARGPTKFRNSGFGQFARHA